MSLQPLGYPIHYFVQSIAKPWCAKSKVLDKGDDLVQKVKRVAFYSLKGLAAMLLRVVQLTSLGAGMGVFIGGVSGASLAVIIGLNHLTGATLKMALIRLMSYIMVSSVFFSIHGFFFGFATGLAIGLLIAVLEVLFFIKQHCH